MSKTEIDWNIIDNKTDEKLNNIESKLDKLLSKNDNYILQKIENIESQIKMLEEKIDTQIKTLEKRIKFNEMNNSTRAVNNIWRSQSGLISLPNLSNSYLNKKLVIDESVMDNID